MGGKTKQSQRTKNNVRPSSSGRSAELLNVTGKGDPSYFGTAGSGNALPVLFPTLVATNIDHGLTAEYLVCFKKFNKKDPVTKMKALQELTELVKSGNTEDAEASLPSWAHHYQFLTIDFDHRVREATQVCHGALVARCGRRVAPQLRRVLPLWLLAQHDEYAPASSIAQTHLQNTFPEGKLPEALSFCKSEIMTLLTDNLSGNADAMIPKRVEDKEEREMQVSRVLASSLRALELFVTVLPTTHDDWLWEAVEPLLQKGYFWNLVRNPSQHIRAGWYGAVGRAVKRFGARFPPALGVKLARALLGEPERAAAVAAQRWGALLLLMRNVETWHTWLQKKDLLITRLLDMLENGAWGEARLLSSMLVPLLDHLPEELLTKQFYINFFSAMFTGLNNKNLLNSKRETQIWISNISECLRYLSAQRQDYVVEVVTYVHRTWLERVLNTQDKQTNNLAKHSATNMASLIKYWLHQSKGENSEQYDQLTRNFWQNVGSTILNQIDKLSLQQEDITQLIELHHLLLKTLQTEFLQEKKKKLSIQFEDQIVDKVDLEVGNRAEDIPHCDAALTDRFIHNFNDVVERTCCSYFDFAHKKEVSNTVCPLLINLLADVESKSLFMALAMHFNADTLYGFYDKVLKPWLAGDTMRCKALADIVFLLAKYLSEDEQDNMFNSFQQFPPPVIEWCISLSLSNPHVSPGARRRWMHGAVVQAGVVALCKREEDSKARTLLLMCFATDDDGGSLVGSATAAHVARALGQRLRACAARAPAPCARLAARLACSLAHGAHAEHAEPLLRALLELRLRHKSDAPSEVRDAWRDGWRGACPALPASRRTGLLRDVLRDLTDHLYHNLNELDIKHIEDAASICRHLVLTEDNSTDISETVSFSQQLFCHVENRQPTTSIKSYALRCDCLHGNIIPAFERKTEFKNIMGENYDELTKEDLMLHVHKCLFRAFYLREITRNSSDSDNETKSGSWCNFVLSDVHFKSELVRVVYEYAILDTLFQYYAFCPLYDIIKQTKQSIEHTLEDILADISVETKDAVMSLFNDLVNKKGHYSAFSRKIFDMRFNKVNSTPSECPSESPEHSPLGKTRSENLCEDKMDQSDDSATIEIDDVDDIKLDSNSENNLHQKDFDDIANDPSLATAAHRNIPELSKQNSESPSESAEFSELEKDSSENVCKDKVKNTDTAATKKVPKMDSNSENNLHQKDFDDIANDQSLSAAAYSPRESIAERNIPEHCKQNSESPSESAEFSKLEKDSSENVCKDKVKKTDTTATQKEVPKVDSNSENILQQKDSDDVPKNSASGPIVEKLPVPKKNDSSIENSSSELHADSEQEDPDCKAARDCFADKSLCSDTVEWEQILGCPSLQQLVDNRGFYLNLEAEAKYSPEKAPNLRSKYMLMMRCMFSTHMYESAVVVRLLADAANAGDGCSLDPIINGYYSQPHLMLFDRTLTDVPWIEVVSNAAIVEYMSDAVGAHGHLLAQRHWDFVNISLSSLLKSLCLSADNWNCTNSATLLRAVSRLLSSVHTCMCAVRVAPSRSDAFSALLEEWDDIFAPDVNRQLFALLATVLQSNSRPVTVSSVTTIGSLIAAMKHMDWHVVPPALAVGPLALDNLAKVAIDAFVDAKHHAYKYLAYHALELIAKPMVFEDAKKLEQWSARADEAPRPALALEQFDLPLLCLQDLTEAALSNVPLSGGTCSMVPFSDSHGVALGYLLLAASLMALCERARGDLRHLYTTVFRLASQNMGIPSCVVSIRALSRERRYAEALVGSALRLLPEPVAAFAFERDAALPARYLPCFQAPPALCVYARCDSALPGALACAALAGALGGAGAAEARGWCGAAPARAAEALRRVARAAVAPALLRRQLRQLRERANELPDATVSILWSRGEVQCRARVEERELELTVRFAPEHPLVAPQVSSPPNALTDSSWVGVYLAYQNESVLNALKMWIRALNARLQSAPQCYVCYCRLHPASGRLPTAPCQQCRNRFHIECLRKWFTTSRKMKCPLCRYDFRLLH